MQKAKQSEAVRSALSVHEWFSGLPDDLQADIVSTGRVRRVQAGDLVYAQRDEGDGIFAVIEGAIRLSGTTACGKPILYRVVGQGGWFGHLTALDGEPRVQDAQALHNGKLLHLSNTGFDSLLASDPSRMRHFTRLICRDIRIFMNIMAQFQTSSISNRIGMMILEMSNSQVSHNLVDHHPLTQESLAAFTGTTRQTVSRVLRTWEKLGHITINYGGIKVHDPAAFSELLDLNQLA